MFAIPPMSGTECASLLSRFGYRMGSRSGGVASLHREANVVIVPMSATLSPALVRAILRTAKVDPFDFVRELPLASREEREDEALGMEDEDEDEEEGPASRVA